MSGRNGKDSKGRLGGKKRGNDWSGSVPRGGGRVGGGKSAASSIAGVPVSVGQFIECEIIGLTHEGEGVGRVEGYTLFVRDALPGETVRAEVLSIGKSFGKARMSELMESGTGAGKGSGIRVVPPCPIYDSCGGCQLQHMAYAEQLRWKRQHVVDNLARIGKLVVAEDDGQAGVVVHPTIGMDDPWRYRNKAQVPIGFGDGGLIGGFYEAGSNDIVEMDACLIQQEENEESVRAVKEAARLLDISAYNRANGRGLLRHVVVRHARSTGQRMVVLVTNGRDIPHAQELVALIREKVSGVVSVCQNVNTAVTPVVFGEETRVLWGEDVIYDEIGGIQFAISPRSFFQVNPEQTERLYGKAVEYAALTGNETVIDAYCGAGTISLFLAKHADRVYGVEIVPEAIEDARRNALLNGIRNAEFAVGPAEVVMPRWQAEGVSPDVIVVDPPRKGCDPALISTMLELRPERIVYVSCNPSTLARDLRLLEDGGYWTVEVQPVDMFPHTGHVECCSLLVRKDI
ncbi:23S rRNA (uracil(1939)-C(5))-methyltransferase RlmD [Cohnella luojiensis]|uniref:23S rRNA (Uracil(1939)-C(5))-methyltransferase RlmD n=1 Tax=Cohnella luojiensis TaxID=652876 RepID=A0A4Y8LYI7_9BACL|nr:23S rRNA (uracil(1939)-C(5))-methyltransferase RlmD [Cohnella luojiensis]TFE26962.1 23S rRNA (uracil(1939)-C(5))-methyltransferase RlmD [Cohnella luojiensis]